MKYAVIITYASGTRTGATVEADSLKKAWDKLQKVLPPDHIISMDMAEIPSTMHEI